ncbi:ATP-binding cassette domain-containing protein [Streptomyces sp. AJS327]|uniref:ABC transporter ATP-binding protein n=1 Tax=Streptomyces sp. AJS327 TaxID=2545265 RepID=UPI0015DFDFE6|nr:ATP-binding cassette domain-containing protein [Streptomyces sp. AJS327]MBA0051837.1 ATP-binding cassette domain-containing protein [Streptomyces sp. AJS327]
MAAPPDNDVLWARGLHHSYDGSPALRGVTLALREGEIVTLTGTRGSGKTTLLDLLSGRRLPQHGEVWFNSVPVHTLGRPARERLRRERFGWIGGTPHLVPELTVWENTALPLLLAGARPRAARGSAREWLDRLDAGDCADLRPEKLPRHLRQRVAIARALVHTPTVLFADEPTAPLHQADRAHVLRTLTAAARSHGITVLLATHDPGPGLTGPRDPAGTTLADRSVTLVDGRSGEPAPHPEEGRTECSLSG